MGVNGRFEFIKQKGLLHNPFSRRWDRIPLVQFGQERLSKYGLTRRR
jgi:hypothetical protein